jgi:hypothetical protein
MFHWPVLLIGIALIVAPLALGMPSKAAAGQRMLNDFHPVMQPAAVTATVNYFNTFQALRPVAIGGQQAASESPQLLSALGASLHMSPAQVDGFLTAKFPAMAGLIGSLPSLRPVFAQVPPGLNWYKPIVATMQTNVTNYREVDSLPNFNLLTWFFVVPGILLVLLAAWPLLLIVTQRGKTGTTPVQPATLTS